MNVETVPLSDMGYLLDSTPQHTLPYSNLIRQTHVKMRSESVITNMNQVKMVQEVTGPPRNCVISHLIEIKFKPKFQLLVSLI